MALAHIDNDAIFTQAGGVQCGGDTLSVDTEDGAAVLLRFEDVPLDADSMGDVEHIYLQVYGSAEGLEATSITISAELGHSEPLPCGSSASSAADWNRRTMASTTATWTEVEGEATGWERHEVWLSVDLREVLAEVVASPHWKRGAAATLRLSAVEGTRQFYSHDFDKCLAPHLSIERSTVCF